MAPNVTVDPVRNPTRPMDWIWPTAVVASTTIALLRVNPVSAHLSTYSWLALQLLPIAVATVAMGLTPTRKKRFQLRVVGWTALVLTAICGASTLWSEDSSRTASQTFVMALVLSFLYLTATRRWPESLDYDIALLFALGAATMVLGLSLRVAGVTTTVGVARRLQGVVGNPNYCGMMAMTVIALGVYVLVRVTLAPVLRLATYAVLGLSLVSLIWAGSRGSVLSVLVFLGGCLFVRSFRLTGRAQIRTLAAGLTLGGLVGAGAWAVAPSIEPPAATLVHMKGHLEANSGSPGEVFNRGAVESGLTTGRSVIWSNVLHLSAKRPVQGYGYRVTEVFMPGNLTAHNIFLSFLLETGAVGLIAFVGLLGSLAWSGFAGRRTDGILLLTVVAIGVQEQVEASLQSFSGPVALLEWLAIFAFAASGVRPKRASRQRELQHDPGALA